MHTIAKIFVGVVALCAQVGVAAAQTDVPQPVQAPESIPGIMVMPPAPPPRPMSYPADGQQDTCPASDLKKLELIG